MDTDKLTELIKREIAKILEEKNLKEVNTKINFCGEDNILKDELSKKFQIDDNGEILVVSSLCINNMIEIALGKTHPVIEYILENKKVYIIEEGLKYKLYSGPKALMENYEKYMETIVKYGVQIVKRTDLISKLSAKTEKTELNGVITISKLQESNIKNTKLILGKNSIITPLAMEYIKENNIEVLYERG